MNARDQLWPSVPTLGYALWRRDALQALSASLPTQEHVALALFYLRCIKPI